METLQTPATNRTPMDPKNMSVCTVITVVLDKHEAIGIVLAL